MIGVDEVGRGAWAGPLLVCALRLNKHITGLADSKTLTKGKRAELATKIIACSDVGYGWASPKLVDKLGLSQCLKLATSEALKSIEAKDYEEIIIDGTVNFAPEYINSKTLIKADVKIPAVSAASIVAKQARDELMVAESQNYPNFGFETNVGYGTKKHQQALIKYGATILHRQSFKPILLMARQA